MPGKDEKVLKTAVCIPVYNAEKYLDDLLSILKRVEDEGVAKIYFIDSSSTDRTVMILQQKGFKNIKIISKEDFNHGRTRNDLVSMSGSDIVVFMTQDAVPANEHSFTKIISIFNDDNVSAVYGRQLPRINSGAIESFSRLFNYPEYSYRYTKQDIKAKGIKAAFLSNSFAAYRVSDLLEVGGFPENIIFGEDMYVAAKLLLSDYSIAYASDAEVYHSHNYSILEEFKRYFDIGVFHQRESWLLKKFGRPQKEGFNYFKEETKYLFRRAPWNIPSAWLRTGIKYLGYKIGTKEALLTDTLKTHLSMNKSYWKSK